jgi:Flp pilus assembly pilin Flp
MGLSERGATMVEYSLIFVFMAVLAIGGSKVLLSRAKTESANQANCVSTRPPPASCVVPTIVTTTTTGVALSTTALPTTSTTLATTTTTAAPGSTTTTIATTTTTTPTTIATTTTIPKAANATNATPTYSKNGSTNLTTVTVVITVKDTGSPAQPVPGVTFTGRATDTDTGVSEPVTTCSGGTGSTGTCSITFTSPYTDSNQHWSITLNLTSPPGYNVSPTSLSITATIP